MDILTHQTHHVISMDEQNNFHPSNASLEFDEVIIERGNQACALFEEANKAHKENSYKRIENDYWFERMLEQARIKFDQSYSNNTTLNELHLELKGAL